MPLTREQLINLLHLPLPELSPPGFDAEQLSGLRTLPSFCEHLKLIFGLRALEPLAERPAWERVEALLLAARILSSVGGVVTRTQTPTLTDSLAAATLALNDLLPVSEEKPVVLQLLCPEMILILHAQMDAQPEESVRCAAGLVRALWEFAVALRRSPGKGAVALYRPRLRGLDARCPLASRRPPPDIARRGSRGAELGEPGPDSGEDSLQARDRMRG
ncbi:MAG: hypothetical protein GY856_40710 [bacterium]|nr:hypothetical protein [bacterium]